MSRRAQSNSSETRRRLVESATEEFAEKGYDGASLRQICSKAGVTTGALYFFYENKEGLFRQVIAPVTDAVHKLFESSASEGAAEVDTTFPWGGDADYVVSSGLLDIFYSNRLTVGILVGNRENRVVKEIFDEATAALESGVREYMTAGGHTPSPNSGFIVSWLAEAELHTLVSILENDETRDEAEHHMQTVIRFTHGGMEALLKGYGA